MTTTAYEVLVTREGASWLGKVADHEGIQTFARTFSGLKQEMDEAIRLMDDIDDAVPLDIHWAFTNVEDDFISANEIGARRKSLDAEVSSLAKRAAEMAAVLQAKGYSVRDISGALEMSPGRVSQILTASDRHARGHRKAG